jgi:hypothetical protein
VRAVPGPGVTKKRCWIFTLNSFPNYSKFEEHLLKKTNFGLTFTSFLAEHFLAITLSRNFGKLLSGTLLGIILGINFGILEDNSGKFSEIRRPWPWPRQGRRLGPRQVWNFSFLAFQGRLPALKAIA